MLICIHCNYYYNLDKNFIIGVKSNRTVALLESDKISKKLVQVSSLNMQDGESKSVWLKDVGFMVTLIKKVFKKPTRNSRLQIAMFPVIRM